MFAAQDHLVVLRHGAQPYQVVLGVPHQSAAGQGQICELRRDAFGALSPRQADENAAAYALAAFSQLHRQDVSCKLVVMAHPTRHDPNKRLDSPYCREIFAEQGELLFECHASSSRRRHALELSAGKNPHVRPLPVGQRMAAALKWRYTLGVQKQPGQSEAWVWQAGDRWVEGRLELPARRTLSLIEAGHRGMAALHLEAKPIFRTPSTGDQWRATPGQLLGHAIAVALVERENGHSFLDPFPP